MLHYIICNIDIESSALPLGPMQNMTPKIPKTVLASLTHYLLIKFSSS